MFYCSFEVVTQIQTKSHIKPLNSKSHENLDNDENAQQTFCFDAVDKNGFNAKFIVMAECWKELYEMIQIDKIYIFKSIKARPVPGFDADQLNIYEFIIDDNSIVERVETEFHFNEKFSIKFHCVEEIKDIEIGESISKFYI